MQRRKVLENKIKLIDNPPEMQIQLFVRNTFNPLYFAT